MVSLIENGNNVKIIKALRANGKDAIYGFSD
jgi:hypothetical protein